MKLAKWRDRQGMSQSELARMIGVAQSQVAKFELGRVPNQRDMAEIRRVTAGKVTANDFYYEQTLEWLNWRRGTRRTAQQR